MQSTPLSMDVCDADQGWLNTSQEMLGAIEKGQRC